MDILYDPVQSEYCEFSTELELNCKKKITCENILFAKCVQSVVRVNWFTMRQLIRKDL